MSLFEQPRVITEAELPAADTPSAEICKRLVDNEIDDKIAIHWADMRVAERNYGTAAAVYGALVPMKMLWLNQYPADKRELIGVTTFTYRALLKLGKLDEALTMLDALNKLYKDVGNHTGENTYPRDFEVCGDICMERGNLDAAQRSYEIAKESEKLRTLFGVLTKTLEQELDSSVVDLEKAKILLGIIVRTENALAEIANYDQTLAYEYRGNVSDDD